MILKSQPTIGGNTTAQNITPGTPPTCPMEDCRQGNAMGFTNKYVQLL